MKYSIFNIYIRDDSSNRVLIKNMLTGAVIAIPIDLFDAVPIDSENLDEHFSYLCFDTVDFKNNGIIVAQVTDEASLWREQLLKTRNDEAHRFILHFLPTIQCQLRCRYCFENGVDRGVPMKSETISATLKWIDEYLARFPDVDEFRMVLFGGEPLLCGDLGLDVVARVQAICNTRQVEFWTEIVTNAELLTEDIAKRLSQHNWRRVQITLDGPEMVHNARRPGVNGRPTFLRIIENIRMLLTTNYIPKVDIRLSFDNSNCDSVIMFLDELARLPNPQRINLSLGLITDTFVYQGDKNDPLIVQKAIAFWSKAKSFGFAIPEDQMAGPLCVATAKHTAVVQPDGSLQKCFASVGRPLFNFGSVFDSTNTYAKDERYEQWKRTDECIAEKCAFLPICGGGCPQDAMIAVKSDRGGAERFCQKGLLSSMNHGLVKINYGS